MILSRIIIGYAIIITRVLRLYFTLNLNWGSYVSHGLRDALPMDALLVITSHSKVLRRDMHG